MADKIEQYEKIIVSTLREYADAFNQHKSPVEAKVIADYAGKHFQLLNCGWQNDTYQFYVIFHFDILNDKVWVQENRTDVIIARELVEQGVDRKDIVLGLQFPELREDSGYAVA